MTTTQITWIDENTFTIEVEKVNRNRPAQKAISATGRKMWLIDSVVANMPLGVGEKTKMVFFRIGLDVSNADLEKEYKLRELKSDPIAAAAVNEADPAFADKYSNATLWKDTDGEYCFTSFHSHPGERCVNVRRNGNGWSDYWWFSGVPEKQLNPEVVAA